MVLDGESIRELCQPERITKVPPRILNDGWEDVVTPQVPMISPFKDRTVNEDCGFSSGLSYAGYDICVDSFRIMDTDTPIDCVEMWPSDFVLGVSQEEFCMPLNVLGLVKDKSSWARRGIAVQNTVLEPGWRGYLTVEINFQRPRHLVEIKKGFPIAQILFLELKRPVNKGYDGKYQNQIREPIGAQLEKPNGTT